MKNNIIISACLLLSITSGMTQENCIIIRDSLFAEDENFYLSRVINYDRSERWTRIDYYEPEIDTPVSFAKAQYSSSGLLQSAEFFRNEPKPDLYMTYKYTYNGGKLTRIEAYGMSGDKWMAAHNLTYDKEGNLKSIMLDQAASKGEPEVFMGSYADLEWKNGNIVSMKMLVNGHAPEFIAVYDDQPNYQRRIPLEDASDILLTATNNNLIQLKLAKELSAGEQKFAAGMLALDREFAYDPESLILEQIKKTSLLDKENGERNKYALQCR